MSRSSIGALPTRSPMPSAVRVHAVGAELERPDRVLEREAAVVVAVPVDADLRARARR